MNRRNLLKSGPAVIGGLLLTSLVGDQVDAAALMNDSLPAQAEAIWKPIDTWSDDLTSLRWECEQERVPIETWTKWRFHQIDLVWTATEGTLLTDGYASSLALTDSFSVHDTCVVEQWIRQNPLRSTWQQSHDNADLPFFGVRHYTVPFPELDMNLVLEDATQTLRAWNEFLSAYGRIPTQGDNRQAANDLMADVLDNYEFYGQSTIEYRSKQWK